MNDMTERILALNPQTDAECEEAIALILDEIQRMNEEMRQQDNEVDSAREKVEYEQWKEECRRLSAETRATLDRIEASLNMRRL